MSISSVGANIFSKVANCRVMKNLAKNYEADKVKFMTGVAVTSIVLKDALGCCMYVHQSLNNDKIPEEKRKFVAALDLANGGLMIAAQLLAFFTISNKKVQEKLFNSLFGKTINRSFRKNVIEKLANNSKFTGLGKKLLNDKFAAYKKTAINAFGMFTTLVASTILAKRVVVPFIATPLATYIKDKHMCGKKETKTQATPKEVCKKYIKDNIEKYNMNNFTTHKVDK
jgi:hypothetical protein